jgi:hypothetical protein
MASQILTPDFGCSAFPRRSFACNAALAAPLVERKRVRFARQLTDEYIIAHRRCQRGLSTSDEELSNRVRRLSRQIKFEKKFVQYQTEEEEYLERLNDKLFHRFKQEMTDLQCKKALDTLKTSDGHLDDDIFNVRMDTLRIKGLRTKVAAQIKKVRAQKAAESCSAVVFAQSLWAMATAPARPNVSVSYAA